MQLESCTGPFWVYASDVLSGDLDIAAEGDGDITPTGKALLAFARHLYFERRLGYKRDETVRKSRPQKRGLENPRSAENAGRRVSRAVLKVQRTKEVLRGCRRVAKKKRSD